MHSFGTDVGVCAQNVFFRSLGNGDYGVCIKNRGSLHPGTHRITTAELLGLPGGSLRAGSPADVVVIDPDTPWVLDPADLKSQCKNTPFDEARFSGRVVRTIVGGRTVYEHV